MNERAASNDKRSRVLIDDHQEEKLTLFSRPIRHKVVRPDVVLVFCTVTDTGIFTAIRKTPLEILFPRDLHVLSLPKSFYLRRRVATTKTKIRACGTLDDTGLASEVASSTAIRDTEEALPSSYYRRGLKQIGVTEASLIIRFE